MVFGDESFERERRAVGPRVERPLRFILPLLLLDTAPARPEKLQGVVDEEQGEKNGSPYPSDGKFRDLPHLKLPSNRHTTCCHR